MRLKRFLTATSALVFVFAAASASAQDDSMTTPGYGGGAGTHLETRLSAVEDQIRTLTGKVEQVDFMLRRMDMAVQRMQGDTEQRLTKLETAPAPTAPAAASHSVESPNPTDDEAVIEANGSLGGMKVRDGKVTGATTSGSKTPPLPAQKNADANLSSQDLYDKSFNLLRQTDYDGAERSFKTFIDKYPKDKLIDNAKYWYAETYYVRGKFGDAAVAFAEAYQQNPKGTKAPDSLLKLAMALAGADKVKDACGTLDALKAKYPQASASIKARADQERARMKCGK